MKIVFPLPRIWGSNPQTVIIPSRRWPKSKTLSENEEATSSKKPGFEIPDAHSVPNCDISARGLYMRPPWLPQVGG